MPSTPLDIAVDHLFCFNEVRHQRRRACSDSARAEAALQSFSEDQRLILLVRFGDGLQQSIIADRVRWEKHHVDAVFGRKFHGFIAKLRKLGRINGRWRPRGKRFLKYRANPVAKPVRPRKGPSWAFDSGLESPVPTWALLTAYTLGGVAFDHWRTRLASQLLDECSGDPVILTFLDTCGHDPEALFGLSKDVVTARISDTVEKRRARRLDLRRWLAVPGTAPADLTLCAATIQPLRSSYTPASANISHE
jgi:hypothetical protein